MSDIAALYKFEMILIIAIITMMIMIIYLQQVE